MLGKKKNIWLPMQREDLEQIYAIASCCHPLYPERDQVLAEKFFLGRGGCFVLRETQKAEGVPSVKSKIFGYALTHPYSYGCIPALDTFLHEVPQTACLLYIHDVALLPAIRGQGAGAQLLEQLKLYAQREQYTTMALVAVNNSAAYWQKFGFVSKYLSNSQQKKLLSYGKEACYMVRQL